MSYRGVVHPEWGYLAPAPGFLRVARAVVIATAIGATAGAGVVFSFVGHPTVETVPTAHMVQPADAISASGSTSLPVQTAAESHSSNVQFVAAAIGRASSAKTGQETVALAELPATPADAHAPALPPETAKAWPIKKRLFNRLNVHPQHARPVQHYRYSGHWSDYSERGWRYRND